MGPQANHHPRRAPYGNYPCQGDDQWVSIAVKTDEEWKALVETMGNPLWALDKRFSECDGRLRCRKELDKQLAGWTSQYTKKEVTLLLQKRDIAAIEVQSMEEFQNKDKHFMSIKR